ncbi:hypothetical protein NQZ79_g7411 [Umbelopsis isabellina]|nr:hypothetical protein NQZ79_g7411 [Umbelopsis isabellina]
MYKSLRIQTSIYALLLLLRFGICAEYCGVYTCTGPLPQGQCDDLPCVESRKCLCLKGTTTWQIGQSTGAGTVKMFSTTDCTGNYEVVPTNSYISNAQWVNSISYGPSGSSAMYGDCGINWDD